MEAVAVRTPSWRLTYAGKDISQDVTAFVTSITYTDHAHGKSDELEIVFEDAEGGWKDAWYPKKGDKVSLAFGYVGEAQTPAGDFEIEEIELAGPPDTLTVRALASGVSKPMRTKVSKAYEDTTLAGVAGAIAAKHGLTVVGEIEDVPVKRITQNQEQDLGFLKRVAASYGYVFSVKGNQLVMSKRSKLAKAAPKVTLDRKDMTRFSIRDKGVGTAKKARIAYSDPKTGEVIDNLAIPAAGDDD
ncbi:MAG: hypothetical protein HQK81_06105 [Desulfovibrionaceae bacterium]|nr:hypothetical protein [Desulfovibrionaceae bacterium]MBF0513622.1 hypothetical protein [Desulfovibrionaceae bacterium]